ncbi:hypothetical protein [Saccharothrix australiensis]|uniref:SPFH domain/Band 7 family protein n=1 Tax=Saccharothrix australiensis TaxID=2072 RepID=A0A495VZD8_9PSEU|nr:hypothetical protein [Saccharothrix australiensis]RKT54811.1 hypothetical protein C8E97_3460 [Saccharothrix australiensis]
MGSATDQGVVREIEVSRSALRKANPSSSGHSAVVCVTRRGEYVTVQGRLTMGELWLTTPREMYVVDISAREDVFKVDLPSQEEAFSFAANLRVRWHVADPVAAVRARLGAPQHSVKQQVEVRLREVSRLFDLESSAAAERRINLDHEHLEIPLHNGVVVDGCRVVLSLDAEAREHIAKRTRARWTREDLAITGETEQQSHLLELQRTSFQRELEALREKHEMDLKMQRMSVYADALRTDNNNLLALRLAGHGEDVNDVIEMIMKQRQLEFNGASAVLNSLLEANLVNRKDVAAIMANASNMVIDQLGGPKGLDKAAEPRPAVAADAVRADRVEEDDDDDR